MNGNGDARRLLLEQLGRFYGEQRFAITFTKTNAGEDAKRVLTSGWQHTTPLADPEYAAGLLGTRGLHRNVAIVLRPSGLVSIECDGPEDLQLVEELELPPTLTVRSSIPTKRHFHFRPDPELEALPAVCFRFESGRIAADTSRYLLAPPSLHPSGSEYAFLPGLGPGEIEIATLPSALYARLLERARTETNAAREAIRTNPEAKFVAGDRGNAIFRYASQQRRWTADRDEILELALLYNSRHCEPPISRARVEQQVDGAMKMPGEQELARNRAPALNAPETALLEPRGVPTDFAGEHTLGTVLAAFEELLVMPDPGAVEVALASIVANYAPGEAESVLLVGPPGCGKSEIVSALRRAPAVWPLSSLTPQTLLSGFERKGRDKGPPASMLLQIGPFGILAFKDLTTVLSMHHEAKSTIVSQLREVADGRMEKSYGNGLRLEWEGKLGLVAGVTPIIDEQHAFLAVMGERFVLYRMPEVTRPEIARHALARRGHEAELRDRIVTLVSEFLARFRDVGYLELPERYTEPLIALADIVTRARTGVARDRQSRDILYLPEPEAPTRFAKQIAQLMAALLKIGVSEDEAWRLALKVGWDSVPAVRSSVIRLLAHEGEELKHAELEEKTGLPSTTVRRVVEDLVVLGLAERRKQGSADNSPWLVSESGIARDYWNSGDGEP